MDSEPNMRESMLYRSVTFNNPFMLCDGIGRSGKVLLAHVAGLVSDVEKQTLNPWFETVATLHWLGEIQTATAVALLKTEADRHTYHLSIGREVNLRLGEFTSIFSNPRPMRYLQRIFFTPERSLTSTPQAKLPIINETTHDALRSAPLFFEAFGERLTLLHVFRHPADLALVWLRKGFGSRIGSDPHESQHLLMRESAIEPLLFYREKPGLYKEINEKERVLAMLAFSYEENLAGLSRVTAQYRERVRLYSFEEVVVRPDQLLLNISQTLNRPVRSSSRRMFRRERVPRSAIDIHARESALDPASSALAEHYYVRCIKAHNAFVQQRVAL